MTDEMVKDTKLYAEQIKGLADTIVSITASLSLDETLQNITDQARQIIGAHQAVTGLTVNQHWAESIKTVSLSDHHAAWINDEEPLDMALIYDLLCLHNKPLRLTQAELKAHPAWRNYAPTADKRPPIRGLLAAPLIGRDGHNIGLLHLSDKYEGEFSESDEAILVQLARIASIAIKNARLYEEAKKNERARLEREENQRFNVDARQAGAWNADEQRYSALFENNPLPAFIYDPERLGFLAVNNAAIREYGYTGKEFLSLKLSDIQLEQKDVIDKYSGASELTGHKLWKHRKKNGTLIEVEYNFQRFNYEGKAAVLITTTNLSKPQNETQSIDQELYLLRSLINKLPGFIYAKDRESRFVFANLTVAAGKNQQRPEDLIGKSDFDYYPPELASKYFAIEQEIMRTGQGILNAEVLDKDENGNDIWSSNTKVPWLDGKGQVIGILGMSFDITERKLAEDALRESEHRYRKLFESNPHSMLVYDLKTLAIKAVNEEAIRHYGYSEKEFLRKTITELRPEEDIKRHPNGQPVDDSQLPGRSFLRHQKKDGTVIDVEATSHEFVLNDRKVRLVLLNDITERKRAEEELRNSEQRYRELFENNPHPMWFYDLETLEFLAVNNAAVRYYGYTREEFLQMTLKDIRPAEDIPILVQDLASFTSQIHINSKRRHKKKDGTITQVEVTSHDISFAGRKARLAMVSDITERLRAEEERDRFFTVSLDMLCLMGFDGYFKRLNPAWEKTLGFTNEELMSKTYIHFVHPDDRKRTFELSERILAGENIQDFENRYLCKDGSSRWLLWSLTSSPQQQLLYAVAHDITERKRAEEALAKTEEHLRQTQKMEAIGRLAGGVAHDFNNLLTAVIGYSEMALKKVAIDNPIWNDILEIKKAGERAATLTNQLLAFGRKQMLQPKILDLNSVVENISKMLRRLIGEHIDIAVVPQAKLGLVKADPGQIEQVIVNLAVNARDAMPKGGKLTLETSNVYVSNESPFSDLEITPGHYVMFAMTDTGVGMDVKTMARIFEPFFTTKELGKGTGLGLSMVYGIIKQSGGHVAIYSESGVGTTVKVYLPRIDDQQFVPMLQTKIALPQKNSETILLVEDEEVVRELTSRILRDLGYGVLVASNGQEALDIAAKSIETIDLVISDIVMPQMGGKELVEKLLLMKPQIKLIYISGYTENSIVHQGVLDPNIDFLQKPFSYEAIAAKVRQVLDKRG
jgi:two-component system, cell cycle sensor histidine kinase and response regulator CckA